MSSGTQRRWQDHGRKHPGDPAEAGLRNRGGGRDRRAQRPSGGPATHRAVRAVCRGRRVPYGLGEPRHDRPALSSRSQGEPCACARAVDPVPTPGRRRPDGQDLVGRYAASSGPRGRPRGRPAGPVPGRTHDRARSRRPDRHVGGHPGAGRRRHLAVADHPVPRGGRPAREQHRGHRPRQGHRGRHGRPAQGPGWRRAPRDHGGRRGPVGGGPGSARAARRGQGEP